MTDFHTWLLIAVIALVTALTRFLPFVIWNGSKKTPSLIEKLGRMLPYAIMGMLVVYCLKGISVDSTSGFLPELVAGVIVTGTYIWKRNTLISIILGTVCYMMLVQLVF